MGGKIKVPDSIYGEVTDASLEVLRSGNYTGRTKLEFVCKEHGVYLQQIYKHKIGQGCPKCGIKRYIDAAAEKRRAENPLPQWFIDSLADKHKEELKNGTYKRRGSKTFVCPIHGEYNMHHEVRLKGGMCPECKKAELQQLYEDKRSKRVESYPKQFLDDVEKSPDRELFLSGKIGGHNKMRFVCDVHGEYTQLVSVHLQCNGCPQCGIKEQGLLFRQKYRELNGFNHDFLEALKGSPDEERFLSLQVNVGEKVTLFCKKHGAYKQTYHDFIQGHRCQKCGFETGGDLISKAAREKNPFPQWFIEDLEGSPDKDDVLSRRLRISDTARFNCKKHGLYEQQIRNHLYGRSCPKCSNAGTSKLEERVFSWFEEHYPELHFTKNERGVISKDNGNALEIDLYFPDYKLGVEIDGLYWHSYELLKDKGVENPKNYHKHKTDICRENGIQLIHIFEDSLKKDFELCMDLIVSKLVLKGLEDDRQKVYARKCEIRNVPFEDASLFYEKNHIQGSSDGTTVGLYLDGELLSCMSFKKCAKNTEDYGSWNLTRYATKRGVFVVGGFERLFKNFVKEKDIKRVISFADFTVSDGSLYERTGWRKVGVLKPDYMYVWNFERVHKFNFRKERFRDDEEFYYEEGLTEYELAEINGLLRVYDCGKEKFEITL